MSVISVTYTYMLQDMASVWPVKQCDMWLGVACGWVWPVAWCGLWLGVACGWVWPVILTGRDL